MPRVGSGALEPATFDHTQGQGSHELRPPRQVFTILVPVQERTARRQRNPKEGAGQGEAEGEAAAGRGALRHQLQGAATVQPDHVVEAEVGQQRVHLVNCVNGAGEVDQPAEEEGVQHGGEAEVEEGLLAGEAPAAQHLGQAKELNFKKGQTATQSWPPRPAMARRWR